MNNPPAKTSGEVIPIKPPPFFRALDRFVHEADLIVQHYDQMQRLFTALLDGRQTDFAACRRAATLCETDQMLLANCKAALLKFDPDSAYEDNDREFGDLRQSVIAERIALLIDSKPTGRPSNPEVFATLFMEDLLAVEDLSLIALDTACREVRQAKPYVPDISDLLPVLRRHLAKWDERLSAIYSLADESRRLMACIDEVEIEAKQAAKARAVYQQAQAVNLARHKLKQARRDAINAEDSYCEASRVLQDAEEALAEAKGRFLICENELAQAEAAVNNNAKASNDGQT